MAFLFLLLIYRMTTTLLVYVLLILTLILAISAKEIFSVTWEIATSLFWYSRMYLSFFVEKFLDFWHKLFL